jgi:hypothetical protein
MRESLFDCDSFARIECQHALEQIDRVKVRPAFKKLFEVGPFLFWQLLHKRLVVLVFDLVY